MGSIPAVSTELNKKLRKYNNIRLIAGRKRTNETSCISYPFLIRLTTLSRTKDVAESTEPIMNLTHTVESRKYWPTFQKHRYMTKQSRCQ